MPERSTEDIRRIWAFLQERIIGPFAVITSDHEAQKKYQLTCDAERDSHALRLQRVEDYQAAQKEREQSNKKENQESASKRSIWISILVSLAIGVGTIWVQWQTGKH